MTAIPEYHRHGGEALQAAQFVKHSPNVFTRGATSGASQISSAVIIFLEQNKAKPYE